MVQHGGLDAAAEWHARASRKEATGMADTRSWKRRAATILTPSNYHRQGPHPNGFDAPDTTTTAARGCASVSGRLYALLQTARAVVTSSA
jgi:hypothetical protein